MIENAGGSTSADVGEGAIPPSPAPHVLHLPERCPGAPHEYDVVTFREVVTNQMGIAVAAAMRRAGTDEVAMESELGMVFLRYGIASWTFPDRCTEPVDVALIERWLPFADGGYEALETANALYAAEVFRPFQRKLSTRSPAGPAARPTSAMTGSGRTPRTPSRRSSRTATAGRQSAA